MNARRILLFSVIFATVLISLQLIFLVGGTSAATNLGESEFITNEMTERNIGETESLESDDASNTEDEMEETMTLEIGTQTSRGFLVDNTLHSETYDIHFSSYIPESYDGTEPYALFITLY